MAELFGSLNGTETNVIMDIDETVYTNPQYTKFRSRKELEDAARILHIDVCVVREMIATKRDELRHFLGREVTRTETVRALGITSREWDEVRYQTWQPEKFLSPDHELCLAVKTFHAHTGIRVCFATNAPGGKGRKTLDVIGLPDSFRCFCPKNVGCLKPDPQFFSRIADQLGVVPSQCLAIGDRRMSDIDPAIAAGFSCGFVVRGRDDFINVLHTLSDRKEF